MLEKVSEVNDEINPQDSKYYFQPDGNAQESHDAPLIGLNHQDDAGRPKRNNEDDEYIYKRQQDVVDSVPQIAIALMVSSVMVIMVVKVRKQPIERPEDCNAAEQQDLIDRVGVLPVELTKLSPC
jgi:hypothetical protein